MTRAPSWGDDRTSKLGELLDAGASSGQAARALRVGRGAVSGRAHRLGWRLGVPRTEDQRNPPFMCIRRGPIVPRKQRPARDPAEAMKGVHCAFDRETYEYIARRAVAQGVTRPQIIRELVEWGIEAADMEGDA